MRNIPALEHLMLMLAVVVEMAPSCVPHMAATSGGRNSSTTTAALRAASNASFSAAAAARVGRGVGMRVIESECDWESEKECDWVIR